MGPLTLTDVVAMYGAGVSTVVAGWTIVKELRERRREKRERTRLRVTLSYKTVKNRPDGAQFHMLPLHVANLGRGDAIVHKVLVRGDGVVFFPGEHSEPGAAYGYQNRVLPCKIEPGSTVELDLLTVAIFRNNFTEIVVIDNDGNEFPVTKKDIEAAREQVRKVFPSVFSAA